MNQKKIIITGAAGFIGSALIAQLNEDNYQNLVLVDDFSNPYKIPNLLNKLFEMKVHRDQLFEWLETHHQDVDTVIHLGARTDTISQDTEIFKKLNIDYSKSLFEYCTQYQLPLIYASSAATYGNGSKGYKDDESIIDDLQPLNAYAKSKNEIDKWILNQKQKPPFWIGLKFFNVYGPNESHKDKMASVVWHAYSQIMKNGKVVLFKSHNPKYKDGEQMRDFIYVKDVVDVIIWMMKNKPDNGIYNLGTGIARSFNDLVNALFAAIKHQANIDYIDTPVEIRSNYQYFTQADISKLRSAGYSKAFMSLEDGIKDYAVNYLEEATCW